MWNRRGRARKRSTESRRGRNLAVMLIDMIASRDSQTAWFAQVRTFAIALMMVAIATLIGLLVAQRWGDQPVVLLYIPPILAAAILGGLRPSLTAGVVSTLAYNFYFTAPYRTFRIQRPADVVTVAILLVVALVTSRLVDLLREQARLATAHAERNATIAGFARRLLACHGEQAIADVTADELARLFDCHAIIVVQADDPQLLASDSAGVRLAPSDFATAAVTLSTGEPAGRGLSRLSLADWQFRPVSSDKDIIAAAGLARDDGVPPVATDQALLLENLLDQAALALERARLEREAREHATTRERDKLRTALLASIGDDVKPGLNAIAAAARALKRAGSGEKATLSSIVAETAKLDRYLEGLIDLAPGDDQEPMVFGGVTLDLHRRTVRNDGAEVHLTPKEYAVFAELAKHAGRVLTHAQLLRAAWGPAHETHIDYLRVAIRGLRQKLEADPGQPVLIINEPAVGYRLAPP